MHELYADHLQIQRARTDDALAAAKLDALAIHSGTPHGYFLDDQTYAFRANPHFKLWLPVLDAPDCWLIYRPGARPRLLFLQPDDYWHKPPAAPSGYWTPHFDIEILREPLADSARLGDLKRCAFIGEPQPQFASWGFAATNPQALLERLHYPRAMKTAYELACMRVASARAARGHVAAAEAFREGRSEYEIHMSYVRSTGHTEPELPYANIVALNEHAAVLHYQHQDRTAPAERRSFLIDAGAQHAGYAADVTRTYCAHSGDFATLIAAMEGVELALCDRVRPGVDYAEIHMDAHRLIAGVLRDAGVIDMQPETALATGLSAVFFPHGVGHLLGLQVHDVGGFSISADGAHKARPAGHPYLRLTRTLEPGFVVTIEPGVYFIDSLLKRAQASSHASHIDWQRVEQFRPYGGIRIEDNVACTSGAPENLTRAAFAAVRNE